jgi:hypothetical protein
LALIVDRWETLDPAIKVGILAIVRAAEASQL